MGSSSKAIKAVEASSSCWAPPPKELSVEAQIRFLPTEDYLRYKKLEKKWNDYYSNKGKGTTTTMPRLTPYWHLRFLRATSSFSSSRGSAAATFQVEKALAAEKKFDVTYQTLHVFALQGSLQTTQCVLPVPGLKTLEGLEVCYMRPIRSSHMDATVSEVLAYVLNSMLERHHKTQIQGMAWIVNLDRYTFSDFDMSYWRQWMSVLQNQIIPLTVRKVVLVNAPSWFQTIWHVALKPLLSSTSRSKMVSCKASRLRNYLASGHRSLLPDDLPTGTLSTKRLVQDFITYRRQVEKDYPAARYATTTTSSSSNRHLTLGDLQDNDYYMTNNNSCTTTTTTVSAASPVPSTPRPTLRTGSMISTTSSTKGGGRGGDDSSSRSLAKKATGTTSATTPRSSILSSPKKHLRADHRRPITKLNKASSMVVVPNASPHSQQQPKRASLSSKGGGGMSSLRSLGASYDWSVPNLSQASPHEASRTSFLQVEDSDSDDEDYHKDDENETGDDDDDDDWHVQNSAGPEDAAREREGVQY